MSASTQLACTFLPQSESMGKGMVLNGCFTDRTQKAIGVVNAAPLYGALPGLERYGLLPNWRPKLARQNMLIRSVGQREP